MMMAPTRCEFEDSKSALQRGFWDEESATIFTGGVYYGSEERELDIVDGL